MATLDLKDIDDLDPDDVIEPVPLTLPLDRKSLSWLASVAGDSAEEKAEIIASMVRMIVDDDEAAHGSTVH